MKSARKELGVVGAGYNQYWLIHVPRQIECGVNHSSARCKCPVLLGFLKNYDRMRFSRRQLSMSEPGLSSEISTLASPNTTPCVHSLRMNWSEVAFPRCGPP